LIEKLTRAGIGIKYLDMGGGLGITYDKELPPALDEYARVIVDLLQEVSVTLLLEPGRVIVGNAGILVTRALYRKAGEIKNFVIVDAGMNDLLRPTLYDAYHAIQPVRRADGPSWQVDLVGPICESSDFLGLDREVPVAVNGELLAVMSAGAYGFSMASNYCSRPRLAEVMVKGDQFCVVRRRQTYEDLTAGETVPPFLE
jgi:diaminopimelate decarboxylase